MRLSRAREAKYASASASVTFSTGPRKRTWRRSDFQCSAPAACMLAASSAPFWERELV